MYLDDCVEEDEGDDQPEHELGLADVPHGPAVLPIPPAHVSPVNTFKGAFNTFKSPVST